MTATNRAGAPATRSRLERSAISRTSSLLSMKVVGLSVLGFMLRSWTRANILPKRAGPRPGKRKIRKEVLRLHAQRAVLAAGDAEIDGALAQRLDHFPGVEELEAKQQHQPRQALRRN